MKLLTKTSLNFISASVLFFLLGSIGMYFAVRTIMAEDLQNRLLHQKNEIIHLCQKKGIQDLASDFVLVQISHNQLDNIFSDTVLINQGQYILYKQLSFSILQKDQYYKVSILQSQSATDLLIMKIVIMNIGFAMLFFLIVFFVNRHSIKSALAVFYNTIDRLEHFEIAKSTVISLGVAEVDEVKRLNTVLKQMSEQIYKDFQSQKEYNENISHELQTPLAIISSKVDELMQGDNLKQDQMEQLALLLETTNRLSKINQALIFLTKIDNRFYDQGSNLCLNDLLKERVAIFKEVVAEKKINLNIVFSDIVYVYMDPALAESMCDNLLKNAIIHNQENGNIEIELAGKNLRIANSGQPLTFPAKDVFKRFVRSKQNKVSLGIGLSVVKSICDLYNFDISYQFKENHIFVIKFI